MLRGHRVQLAHSFPTVPKPKLEPEPEPESNPYLQEEAEEADSNSETEAEMMGNESEAETPRASAASAASVEEEPMLASLEGPTPRRSKSGRKSSFTISSRRGSVESVWQHHTSKLAHQVGLVTSWALHTRSHARANACKGAHARIHTHTVPTSHSATAARR